VGPAHRPQIDEARRRKGEIVFVSDGLAAYRVPVADILASWNPFNVWGVARITQADVLAMSDAAVRARRGSEPIDLDSRAEIPRTLSAMRLRHIARIAWLVQNVDETPIEIEVGCPSLDSRPRFQTFEVSDGNHRLAAAAIRRDDHIVVYPGGELDHFERLFPAAIPVSVAEGEYELDFAGDEPMTHFTVSDVEDGVIVIDPSGDEIAHFRGDGAYNVAFLAFIEGMRRVPEASVWSEAGAKYLVHGGKLDEEFGRNVSGIATNAAALHRTANR
jgi:hypothetical protein